jgi:hypothetical protein
LFYYEKKRNSNVVFLSKINLSHLYDAANYHEENNVDPVGEVEKKTYKPIQSGS